jgi:RNA polymerase sigma-70 factor, ECF subfamily
MVTGSDDAESLATRRADQRRAELSNAVIKVGQGDRAAFEFLYRKTAAKLFGVCLRIFPERTEAEDALQDAYLTIWNRAASFEPRRASPISWLVTVTRNRAIDRLRASGKMRVEPVEAANEVVDPTPLADASLLAGDEDRALHGCIGTLDDRDASFIRAAFMGGTTYADLAEREALPLGTVKSRIRRALLRLRACLEGE